MNSNRVISAMIGIPVVYLFVAWGGFPFFLLVLALALGALNEFTSMCSQRDMDSSRIWAAVITVALIGGAYASSGMNFSFNNGYFMPLLITLTAAGTLVTVLVKRDLKTALLSAGVTYTGILYIGWLLMHAVLLRELRPFGFQLSLTVIFATWTADISAYYVGTRFGRHRLHAVSPKKSWAGAAAALTGGLAGMLAMKYILALYFIEFPSAAVMGLSIGFLAVLGDLVESMIKRNLTAKDSGKFLPGHGGILDRLDSLLFTVPFVYYFSLWSLR